MDLGPALIYYRGGVGTVESSLRQRMGPGQMRFAYSFFPELRQHPELPRRPRSKEGNASGFAEIYRAFTVR